MSLFPEKLGELHAPTMDKSPRDVVSQKPPIRPESPRCRSSLKPCVCPQQKRDTLASWKSRVHRTRSASFYPLSPTLVRPHGAPTNTRAKAFTIPRKSQAIRVGWELGRCRTAV